MFMVYSWDRFWRHFTIKSLIHNMNYFILLLLSLSLIPDFRKKDYNVHIQLLTACWSWSGCRHMPGCLLPFPFLHIAPQGCSPWGSDWHQQWRLFLPPLPLVPLEYPVPCLQQVSELMQCSAVLLFYSNWPRGGNQWYKSHSVIAIGFELTWWNLV